MSLSPLIRFGTSTWTYEGWQGQVYHKQYAKTAFARECLGEYCQYLYKGEPLFRTVGNDSTFYLPPHAGLVVFYRVEQAAHGELAVVLDDNLEEVDLNNLPGESRGPIPNASAWR